jgi:parallel beta-helix repeat protein
LLTGDFPTTAEERAVGSAGQVGAAVRQALQQKLPDAPLVDLTGPARPVTIYGQPGAGFMRSGSYTFPIIDVSRSSDVIVANIRFDEDSSVPCDSVAQPGQCQSTIRTFDASNITIDNVTILHSKRMGVELRGSSNITIRNSVIEDSGIFGVWSGTSSTSNLLVENRPP